MVGVGGSNLDLDIISVALQPPELHAHFPEKHGSLRFFKISQVNEQTKTGLSLCFYYRAEIVGVAVASDSQVLLLRDRLYNR